MSGDRTPEVFLSSKHSELNGTFSPDGRWVAYQSDASGRYEVRGPTIPEQGPRATPFRAMAGCFPAGVETARSFSSCRQTER